MKRVEAPYRGAMGTNDPVSVPHVRLAAARAQLPGARRWRRSIRGKGLDAAFVGRNLPAALCVALLDGEDIDLSEVACQDQRLIAKLLMNLNRSSRRALLRELGEDEVLMLNRLDMAMANATANKPTMRDADQASTGRLRRSADTARIVAELTGQTIAVSRAASEYRRRISDHREPYDA